MGGNGSKNDDKKQHTNNSGYVPEPPKFQPPEMRGGPSSLLKTDHIEAICKQLQFPHKQVWNLVYDSQKHGKSFSRFGTEVLQRGPTLVVIQDTDGYIFGGFCDTSWKTMNDRFQEAKRNAAAQAYASSHDQEYEKKEIKKQDRMFFGSSRCFLFRAEPKIGIFTPSGYNSNFMYYNENLEVPELRGVGMGGQVQYFGWFMDGGLESGHSWARSLCYTFDSPCLSQSEKFTVQAVEVWQVDKAVIEEEQAYMDDQGGKKKDARDNDDHHVDKIIMQLDGREFYGDNGADRGCGGP